jgi:hypothetical protein
MEGTNVKIRFAVNMDDLVAFNRFHARSVWNSLQTVKAAGVSVLLILLLQVLFARDFNPVFVGTSVVGGVPYALALRLYMIWCAGRATRKAHTGAKNKGTLGWHDLEITETGLRETSEAGAQDVRFDGIEKIAESESHVFIYIGAVLAHVVPKAAVTEGNVATFVSRLRELTAEHAG